MSTINNPEVLSEHDVRVEKIGKLRDRGVEPWPALKPVSAPCQKVLEEYQEDHKLSYSIAGRLMNIRLHGKAAFAHVQDGTAKIQIYLKADTIGVDKFEIFKDLIDIGDILWCSGDSFKTRTGEITLNVTEFVLLSKCLHPLPEKFHGLSDIEIKYRQRYLDLMTSQESRERFIKRSSIIRFIREFLEAHGYLEVETPMLHPIAGGAAARPFVTHHNALNTDLYLRIAPELYLKRLLVGGLERVYELNRNFRNEGISTKHNPEFTMLEFYTAYQDYLFSMDFTEQLIKTVFTKICGTLSLTFSGYELNFSQPFARLTLVEAVKKYANLSDQDLQITAIDATLARHNLTSASDLYGQKLLVLFDELVEKQLIQPTFIIGYPVEVSPLAKRDTQDRNVAARFELFIAGMEISNGYNELNDPIDQAERFAGQMEAHAAGDEEAHKYDEDFVRALEYGLPPTSGVGIGIDRLVMLATGTSSIKEVILFPTLKPKDDGK
jgi:lysyl-tRNA synthetase class 2